MANLISKIIVTGLLVTLTVGAYGACFRGWFLPEPLKQPVSLRDGSAGARTHGHGFLWLGSRSYSGGGYRSGK